MPRPSESALKAIEEVSRLITNGEIDVKDVKAILDLCLSEIIFWSLYAEIYPELEKASPYKKLLQAFGSFISNPKGNWLDLGTGSAKIIELLWLKAREGVSLSIVGVDAVDNMIQHAENCIKRLPRRSLHQVQVIKHDLTNPLCLDTKFDGITANLVFPYIFTFQKRSGQSALEALLRQAFELLKPGGQLVWSTPKKGVRFVRVFLASWRDALSSFSNLKSAWLILQHAWAIQEKGEKGIYCFLNEESLDRMMRAIGFIDLSLEYSFAKQVIIISAYKPQEGGGP